MIEYKIYKRRSVDTIFLVSDLSYTVIYSDKRDLNFPIGSFGYNNRMNFSDVDEFVELEEILLKNRSRCGTSFKVNDSGSILLKGVFALHPILISNSEIIILDETILDQNSWEEVGEIVFKNTTKIKKLNKYCDYLFSIIDDRNSVIFFPELLRIKGEITHIQKSNNTLTNKIKHIEELAKEIQKTILNG